MSRLPHDDEPAGPLDHVALGDLIRLPDGRELTATARVDLAMPVGSMTAFIIAGELETLLSRPVTPDSPVNVYVPIDYIPPQVSAGRVACEGATAYYAPHLPMLSGAMGELQYRVVQVRGSIDPAVIVYRGREIIVFIRSSFAYPQDLGVMYMPRSVDNDVDVARHSSVVHDPARVPVTQPQHADVYETFTRR